MMKRQNHGVYTTSARLRYAAYIKSAALAGEIVRMAP